MDIAINYFNSSMEFGDTGSFSGSAIIGSVGLVCVIAMKVFDCWTQSPEECAENHQPSYILTQEEMRAEEGGPTSFLVDRQTMISDPLQYVALIRSHIADHEQFSVCFVEEEGVDASGLSKDFFTAWFEALKGGRPHGLLSMEHESLEEHGLSPQRFYDTIVREVFPLVASRSELMIEECFDPAVVRCLFSIPDSTWRDGFVGSVETGEPSQEVLLALCKVWNDVADATAVTVMYEKFIQYLKGDDGLFAELKEYVESVEEEEFISEEAIRGYLATHLSSAYHEKSMNSFYFMRALCACEDGLLDEGKYLALRESAEAGNVLPAVQGAFNVRGVVDAIKLSDSVSWRQRTAFKRKVDRLKHALRTIATPEEVRLFARFVTGRTVFTEGHSIKVAVCAEEWKYVDAETCYDLFSLYAPTREGVDDTDERLLRSVLTRMQGMSFLNR